MEFSNELALGFYNEKLDAKADIDSPSLTGVPTAPTPTDDAGSSQIATVEYVLAHGADNLMVATDDEVEETLKNIFGIIDSDSEPDNGDEPDDDGDDDDGN